MFTGKGTEKFSFTPDVDNVNVGVSIADVMAVAVIVLINIPNSFLICNVYEYVVDGSNSVSSKVFVTPDAGVSLLDIISLFVVFVKLNRSCLSTGCVHEERIVENDCVINENETSSVL